jgi:hypothetical protein
VQDGAIKAAEPTPIMVALPDTRYENDGIRSLLCTKFIYFRHKNLGGKRHFEIRELFYIILLPGEKTRSV